MKHKHSNRTLGRTAKERGGLLRNLSHSLLEHGSIVTTAAKAKELRRFVEPLITTARGEISLHRRRTLLRKLHCQADLPRLLAVAGKHTNRTGGYTRITKLPTSRHDDALMARIDIIDFDRESTS